MADDWDDLDDWELDDWDEDTFDEDEWDASQGEHDGASDDLDEGFDELAAPETEPFAADPHRAVGGGRGAGGGAGAAPAGAGGSGAAAGGAGDGGLSWSAWEVGTVFALGGWLADHHAAAVGRQVRDALAAGAGQRAAGGARPRGAPQPAPPSGVRYATATGSVRLGEPLDAAALCAELAAAGRAGRDLLLQAEGCGPGGGALVLVISAVPSSAGPGFWIVAEEHRGGFSASHLVPVFQPERQGGLAVFASDLAEEAADAAVWACGRAGVALTDLRVTQRRP
jgi:hypothetical protein